MNTSMPIRNWRSWTLTGIYTAVVLGSLLLRGTDPPALALYRVTLPWSSVTFGSTSDVFGWFILVAGVIINCALVFLLGLALDRRANGPSRAA